jgi:hypothetical protein
VEDLRAALVIKCGAEETLDLPDERVQQLRTLAEAAPLVRVTKALKRLGEVNLRHAPAADVTSLPLELAVVEACSEETPQPTSVLREAPPAIPRPAGLRSRSGAPSMGRPLRTENPREPPVPARAATDPPAGDPPKVDGGGFQGSELQVVTRALSRYKGKRFNIGGLLRDCKTHHREGETVVLQFSHRSNLERMQEELEDPQCRSAVETAFAKVMGAPCSLKLALAEGDGPSGAPASSQSPLVRAALSMGAKIVEEKERNE